MKLILTHQLHFGLCLTAPILLPGLKGVSANRSWSKTFNRSHMTDSRLSSLTMLSIEASSVRTLDLADVIKASTCQKTRSKPFRYYPTIMWHCFRYCHIYCYVIFFMCATVPLCSDFFCFAVWPRPASWAAMR